MILTSLAWILHVLIPPLVFLIWSGAGLFFSMRVAPLILLFLIVVLAILGYWMSALLTFAGSVLVIVSGYLMYLRFQDALDESGGRNVTKRRLGKYTRGGPG